MLEQAQEMQKKMADAKESLKNISVEGESGGGGVKVILNGNGEMICIVFKTTWKDKTKSKWYNRKKNVESKNMKVEIEEWLQLPAGFKLPF